MAPTGCPGAGVGTKNGMIHHFLRPFTLPVAVHVAWLPLALACSEGDGDSSSASSAGNGTLGSNSVSSTTGGPATTGASATTGGPAAGSSNGTTGTSSTTATATGGGTVQGSGGAASTGGTTTGTGGGTTGSGGSTTTSGSATTGAGGNPPTDCVPDGRAHNPLVTQIFTADPNAIVYGDKVYVYTSHDADGQEGFEMIDYHAYSSDDMVNWQDHGVIIHSDDLPWAPYLFAPGACSKNGEYYLYMPNSGSAIGVAVSDDPGGPFVDPLGDPLITPSFPNANVPWLFDPACFIDDDGQAYLYFGGGDNGGQNARVVRLNDDMISIKDSMATTIPTTAFFEASFMHKHEGRYYFSYSSDFSSGHGAALEYLIGDSPMSGFVYEGKFLESATINRGNNNHGSIIEFGGKHYLFYHNRKLEQELGVDKINNRSIAVQEITY
ncbi:MAG TPA: family 43 glycosylhydrolase, partial [Polyangiaceae bacterium]|nr:family 43 glycosylhydrolase [Polyangiaceae bacterium]